MAKRVHLILGTAKAKPGTNFPAHEERAFIVFALVELPQQAAQKATNYLGRTGWHDVNCKKTAVVNAEMLDGMRPEVLEAYEDAVGGKTNAIIFSDPVA